MHISLCTSALLLAATVFAADSTHPRADDALVSPRSVEAPLLCPPACPCCEGCEPAPECRKGLLPHGDTFLKLRSLVGCNSLPLDTPLCPADKCEPDCLCGEKVIKDMQKLLFESRSSDEPKASGTDAPAMLLRPPKHPVNSFYCPNSCPCCNGCRHLPGCPERLLPGPHEEFLNLRDAVGCDTLPITTELCPADDCHMTCLCREAVLKDAKKALFGGGDEDVKAPQKDEL